MQTDINDAQWLEILARNGLLRGGFVSLRYFRDYRLVARQLQKWTSIAPGERNRLHKLLTDVGIRLSVLVSDLSGKTAHTQRSMSHDQEATGRLISRVIAGVCRPG